MRKLKIRSSLSAFLLLSILFYQCVSTSVMGEDIPEAPTPSPTPPDEIAATIAFYNVENLFDTLNDPTNPRDDEFLPDAAKAWTLERYQHKLSNLEEVIQGMDFPIILGLAEVENRTVLEDLAQTKTLRDYSYQIVHEESPDHRGIDVALLYRPEQFTVTNWEAYAVQVIDPDIANYTTRDILVVEGQFDESQVFVIVNHWPSRSGGTSKTAFRRAFAAEQLKTIVNNIQQTTPNARIIIMGDFNDEPTNESVSSILGAITTKEEMLSVSSLYNCSGELDELGEGTYNFRGNWQMIDQIIATGNLLQDNVSLQLKDFQIYRADNLFFTHPEYGLSPNRTYGGDRYFGGYSDHLPVFMEIVY